MSGPDIPPEVQTEMLYPVFALMTLTIVSLFILMFARVVALRAEKLHQLHLKSMDYERESNHWLTVAMRHYENLGILSGMFYTVTILIIVFDLSSPLYVTLAWLFVGFRFVHSLIHLTYNNVIQRMAAFLISNTFLMTMVFVLITQIATGKS